VHVLQLTFATVSQLSTDGCQQIAQCRTRLAVQPKAGEAILFYSQNPDGTTDELSRHGACPVLVGDKWAGRFIMSVATSVRPCEQTLISPVAVQQTYGFGTHLVPVSKDTLLKGNENR
jgi:hypothetical protein